MSIDTKTNELLTSRTGLTRQCQVQDKPSGATWESESDVKNEGYTYSYTFETAGTYKYYCEPHLSLGMKGVTVVV
ncbi:plastocyanin/azurin family copper-binding protein [Halarchaeum nitratireducens]|uniref:Blue (type 1) copper domain-containing protein n=1 Tax=Halarchaeum nitratireducens TaxID=489913 RepID=A0A830GDK5_9EURY|nr:plastocyanin/azurin family copper-binding protein [Halarchaeum nitratireducens]GGN24498.1 hypothetical protein GCM10009021_27880 [Halarchaeum nitratireducens]